MKILFGKLIVLMNDKDPIYILRWQMIESHVSLWPNLAFHWSSSHTTRLCILNIYSEVSYRKPEHMYLNAKSTTSLNPYTTNIIMFHCSLWDSTEHVEILDRFIIQKILDMYDNRKTVFQKSPKF